MEFVSSVNRALRGYIARHNVNPFIRRFAAAIWSWFLNKRESIELVVNGMPVRLIPYYRSFSETYEPEVFRALEKLLPSFQTFVDVGANMGLYTILAARKMNRNSRIISIEANPFTFDILTRHISLNRIPGRVIALRKAIADSSGHVVHFGAAASNAGDPCARIQKTAGGSVEATTLSLDDLMAGEDHSKTLIKIDVEGAEHLVLRGAVKQMHSSTPPVFLVAVHPMFLPEFGVSPEQVLSFLMENDYAVFNKHGIAVGELVYDEYWCVSRRHAAEFVGRLSGLKAEHAVTP
jgi:FkbM family methyltransferase